MAARTVTAFGRLAFKAEIEGLRDVGRVFTSPMRASKSAQASSTSRGAFKSSANSGSTASSCRRTSAVSSVSAAFAILATAASGSLRVAATPPRIAFSAASIAARLVSSVLRAVTSTTSGYGGAP